MKAVWLIVSATIAAFLLLASCKRDPVNQPPVPSFTISPDSGDTETPFVLDASGSFDPDDPEATLEYRWDFEDDGIYDWLYVNTRINIHKFPAEGRHTVRLQARDEGGATATVTRQVSVVRGNRLPLIPFAPNPRDSSNNILFAGRLSWVSIDPDDDHLTYDLYLGLTDNPPLVETDLPKDEYYPSSLIPGRRYYWKIVSRDPGGFTAESPVWRFSLHSGTYERDSMTDPRDGQRYPIIKLNGTWWMTRNMNFEISGSSYCYENDPKNCDQYGRLYFEYLQDSLICPHGWRIPKDGDWSLLEQSLGLSRDLTDQKGWIGNDQAYQMMEGGTSGLDLQFSGYADCEKRFYFLNDKAFYSQDYIFRMMIRNYGQIYRNSVYSDNFKDACYTAVRCIRNN